MSDLSSSLTICTLCSSDELAQSLEHCLREDLNGEPNAERSTRPALIQFTVEDQFLSFIRSASFGADCLVFERDAGLQSLFNQLQQEGFFYPAVILNSNGAELAAAELAQENFFSSQLSYHPAVLELSTSQLSQISRALNQAIQQFIQLALDYRLLSTDAIPEYSHSPLIMQQRLSEKLKERLGYAGLYYKRNPQNFFHRMPSTQKGELLRQLQFEYREIVLIYFSDESSLNQRIDSFVNLVFLTDVPVSQVVEIHMGLMDEFSKQLRLEGRSDEILQDYRLTLIDTIAHLCEMYRRSISRAP